jgi:hypothetical protein
MDTDCTCDVVPITTKFKKKESGREREREGRKREGGREKEREGGRREKRESERETERERQRGRRVSE